MYYATIGLVVLVCLAVALYHFLHKRELESRLVGLRKSLEEQDASHAAELAALRSELAKLDKFRHVPGVLERAKKTEREIAATLEQAQARAYEILRSATEEANSLKEKIIKETESDAAEAKEARKVAEWQANKILEEARKQAKEIASQARKDAKEKTRKVEEALNLATAYALEIRQKAEARAEQIGGKAYEALKRHDFYKATAKAMENVRKRLRGHLRIADSITSRSHDPLGIAL
jgi:vacuolar-type H+-ATPase subunit H